MTRESAREIEAQAASWLMRLDRDGRTPETEKKLSQWLAGDARRRGALLQAEAAWALIGRLGDESETAPLGAGARSVLEPARRPNRRSLLLGGGAAALAASFAGALWLWPGGETYDTAVGEIRRVPLADGSTAAVNTASRVAVQLDAHRRIIRVEQGEAWFRVARDPDRPFLVMAGPVRVMALGTAFSVRRRENGADILVSEGVVAAWTDGAEGNRIELRAGERAFVADNAQVRTKPAEAAAVDRALAWRGGRIDLAGETLEEAVAEFNRYNRRPIVIADAQLARQRFHGLFRTDDPEGFALAVQSSLSVPVRATPREILIGRAPQ